jgi:hypothetical protein
MQENDHKTTKTQATMSVAILKSFEDFMCSRLYMIATEPRKA